MEAKKINPRAQIVAQIGQLKRYFPSGRVINETMDSLTWEVQLQPTELSRLYTIRLKYKVDDFPAVYVTDPFPLERYSGKDLLEHVYSTSKQKLCLFKPDTREWTSDKMIAKTIIPWAAEWLQFYELWLATGDWYGEGFHPEKKDKKRKKI